MKRVLVRFEVVGQPSACPKCKGNMLDADSLLHFFL